MLKCAYSIDLISSITCKSMAYSVTLWLCNKYLTGSRVSAWLAFGLSIVSSESMSDSNTENQHYIKLVLWSVQQTLAIENEDL